MRLYSYSYRDNDWPSSSLPELEKLIVVACTMYGIAVHAYGTEAPVRYVDQKHGYTLCFTSDQRLLPLG